MQDALTDPPRTPADLTIEQTFELLQRTVRGPESAAQIGPDYGLTTNQVYQVKSQARRKPVNGVAIVIDPETDQEIAVRIDQQPVSVVEGVLTISQMPHNAEPAEVAPAAPTQPLWLQDLDQLQALDEQLERLGQQRRALFHQIEQNPAFAQVRERLRKIGFIQ